MSEPTNLERLAITSDARLQTLPFTTHLGIASATVLAAALVPKASSLFHDHDVHAAVVKHKMGTLGSFLTRLDDTEFHGKVCSTIKTAMPDVAAGPGRDGSGYRVAATAATLLAFCVMRSSHRLVIVVAALFLLTIAIGMRLILSKFTISPRVEIGDIEVIDKLLGVRNSGQ